MIETKHMDQTKRKRIKEKIITVEDGMWDVEIPDPLSPLFFTPPRKSQPAMLAPQPIKLRLLNYKGIVSGDYHDEIYVWKSHYDNLINFFEAAIDFEHESMIYGEATGFYSLVSLWAESGAPTAPSD